MAIYNSGENKSWTLNYAAGIGLRILEDGVNARMTFDNGGNIGIGTSAPAYKLDVVGAIRASDNIQTQGDLSVTGDATVNGGGVAYNGLSTNNIKIARFVTPQPAAWAIPAHGSVDWEFDLPAGFTSTPVVMVASQHSSGGTAGELYRVILVIHGCSIATNKCNAKVINTDNTAINYWVRWNLIAMQF